MTTLWDSIRRMYVSATPEERVRQKWLSAMTRALGYPKSLLAVEKSVKNLSKEPLFNDPARRVDIVCFTPSKKEGLAPLLIVECKADAKLGDPAAQVSGYNFTVGAPFLCIIQGDEATTFWQGQDQVQSVSFLPKYENLLSTL